MLTIRFEPVFFGVSPVLGPTPCFHLIGDELRLEQDGPALAYHRGYEWCHASGFHIVLRVDMPVRLHFDAADEMTVGPFAMLRIADGHLQTGEGQPLACYEDETGRWQVSGREATVRRITVTCACPRCANVAAPLPPRSAPAGRRT